MLKEAKNRFGWGAFSTRVSKLELLVSGKERDALDWLMNDDMMRQ